MTISTVAWAIQPAATQMTRPMALIRELKTNGIVADSARVFHHGKSPSSSSSLQLPGVRPALPSTESSGTAAVLSPVFESGAASPAWVDLYDDWSIAPDINPIRRLAAARTYSQVRRRTRSDRGFGHSLITVNSRYMALKVGVGLDHVVPNGVDQSICDLESSGDSRYRFVLLGKFFSSRTDYSLIERIANLAWLDELVIGSPGKDPKMMRCIGNLRQVLGDRLKIYDWVDSNGLAELTGTRTVAVIPHVVTDYTISQDLMKAYLFYAHGVKVLCPLLLWPPHLSKEFAFLNTAGDSIERNLRDWMGEPGPDSQWRKQFGRENSWSQRASIIQHLLES